MKRLNLLIIFLLYSWVNYAQIQGVVKDSQTGEPLLGAHIILYHINGKTPLDQTISGKNGEFVFTGNYPDRLNLTASFLGYRPENISIQSGFETKDISIELDPSFLPVGEVSVTALRQEKSIRDVPIPLAIAGRQTIERIGGFSPTEMLTYEPGIHTARDGIWATSMNIRGFSEQRIINLVDGNRIETANDIAAGMSMVDINDIERIEVIKGAASSLYGTGAMGGVVNIITRSGRYNEEFYVEGNATAQYQSVNSMHGEHLALGMGDQRWYIRLSGSFRDAQNTMTPEGELDNSQFLDNNISLKAGVKPTLNQEISLNFQRFYARDVGLPGGSAFPGPAKATYPEELRNMLSAQWTLKPGSEFFRELSIKYFHQYILRDVELIPNPNTVITPTGYHTTNGVQLKSYLIPSERHSLVAGLDLWQRHLETEREKNINQPLTDEEGNLIGYSNIIRGEVPIPAARYSSAGLYLQDEFSNENEKLKFTLGGRFDFINVTNERAVDPLYLIVGGNKNDNPPGQKITFEANDVNNYSWSANFGLIYKTGAHSDLTLSLSRAFRSPNIEERYKYIDLTATSGLVRIGDPELKPEDGYFGDLGFRIWKDRLHLKLNGFINSMTNLIVEVPGEAIYNLTADESMQDTIPALINSNVDKALLYGFDLSFHYQFYREFVFSATSSYVRGMDTRTNTDLPMIPPLKANLGLAYSIPGWIGAEIRVNLIANQNKVAEGENTTPGYSSWDFRIHSPDIDTPAGRIRIFAGVENFTNRAYRNHLATNRGLIRLEPGRNFYARLSYEF